MSKIPPPALRKEHLNTRVSSLQEHLSELERVSAESVSKQRETYNAKLQEQEKQNQAQ